MSSPPWTPLALTLALGLACEGTGDDDGGNGLIAGTWRSDGAPDVSFAEPAEVRRPETEILCFARDEHSGRTMSIDWDATVVLAPVELAASVLGDVTVWIGRPSEGGGSTLSNADGTVVFEEVDLEAGVYAGTFDVVLDRIDDEDDPVRIAVSDGTFWCRE